MKKQAPKALRPQIAALKIIRALESHALGRKEMSDSQIAVAMALLEIRWPEQAKKQPPAPRRKAVKLDGAGDGITLKDLA